MAIYVSPKLSKNMTALGAYNIKLFTYEINQHTQARRMKFVLRKIRQRNKSRRLETLLKEMYFQSLSESQNGEKVW